MAFKFKGENAMKLKKRTVIISVAITLLPCLIGLLLWNRLPEVIATHFGSHNEPNGWSSKTFTVLGLPAFFAGVQLFCLWAITNDPRRKNINGKLFTVVLWIIPVISQICCLSTYAIALHQTVNVNSLANIAIGIVFLLIGNYMPKAKQNYTVGIKLPWTLNSEENWNRTHRMAGRLWVLGGLVMLVNVFFHSSVVLIVVLCAMVILPFLYSFLLFKKGI